MAEWVRGVLAGHRLRVLRHGRGFRARCECGWTGLVHPRGSDAARDAGVHKIHVSAGS
ncbi:hypothetical protein GCM10022263_44460 [Nocardioides daeguensis]|uniref:Uncharacterized protein n=1 Tax=Nocardioides daeguensis TaxID=908359 RepID=A0ABP6WRJ2_9ACTN